jgi:TolA-binding protein
MSLRKMIGKTVFCTMVGASLLAGVATPARADRDDACRRQVRKAEENLEKAVRKHGQRSKQAEQRRRQLEETRERCHMRDHDHDRDHDRDHH